MWRRNKEHGISVSTSLNIFLFLEKLVKDGNLGWILIIDFIFIILLFKRNWIGKKNKQKKTQ